MSCNPPVPTFPGLEVGPVWIRAGANPVGCVVYWWPVLNAEQRSEIWSVLVPGARLEVLALVELANRYAVSGIVATERGARNNKLHLQGVFSVRLSPPTA